MKKDSKDWIDKRAPKHLSSSVLSGALYIHNGKDVHEKVKRTNQVLNKIGKELTACTGFVSSSRDDGYDEG